MAPKTIRGSERLASMIRARRIELGLTIQEASTIAGVGIKTWCRYETGESIRKDKCRGICKALNWTTFPDESEEPDAVLDYYKNCGIWSQFIEDDFGEAAAISFCAGGEILSDEIEQDLEELSKMPAGTHLGQVSFSMIKDLLPPQFLMKYDYEFVYRLKLALGRMLLMAGAGESFQPSNVLEELLLKLIVEEAEFTMETVDDLEDEYDPEWIYELVGDADIEFLYSNFYYVEEDNDYHFDNWLKPFYE